MRGGPSPARRLVADRRPRSRRSSSRPPWRARVAERGGLRDVAEAAGAQPPERVPLRSVLLTAGWRRPNRSGIRFASRCHSAARGLLGRRRRRAAPVRLSRPVAARAWPVRAWRPRFSGAGPARDWCRRPACRGHVAGERARARAPAAARRQRGGASSACGVGQPPAAAASLPPFGVGAAPSRSSFAPAICMPPGFVRLDPHRPAVGLDHRHAAGAAMAHQRPAADRSPATHRRGRRRSAPAGASPGPCRAMPAGCGRWVRDAGRLTPAPLCCERRPGPDPAVSASPRRARPPSRRGRSG